MSLPRQQGELHKAVCNPTFLEIHSFKLVDWILWPPKRDRMPFPLSVTS